MSAKLEPGRLQTRCNPGRLSWAARRVISWLGKFQAVVPGIAGIEAVDCAQRLIPNAADARSPELHKERIDVTNSKRRMRFQRRTKRLLHTDVQLALTDPKQTSPAASQWLRFLDLF
jgi:hypothetical protein